MATASLFARGRVGDRALRRLRAPLRQRERARAEAALAEFSRGEAAPCVRRVLIDATYDNPNYWLRYALVRRALGLRQASEIAFTDRYRVAQVTRTLARFGVADVRPFARYRAPADPTAIDSLLAGVRGADDVLALNLPGGFPATDAYDAILKRQQRSAVDVDDPGLRAQLGDILASLAAADRLLDDARPDLLILSHTASGNTGYGPIAWRATQRGVPVLVPWGGPGHLQFYKVRRWEDSYAWSSVPDARDMDGGPAARRQALAALGKEYLAARVAGRAGDAASTDAYGRGGTRPDRSAIAERHGWDPSRPLVCVYASVWFDNPHVFGMASFRDFADWLATTVAAAAGVPEVNWLLKPHPAELFYGGPSVGEAVGANLPANVGVCPHGWNGLSLLDAVDGAITLHGTIGLEAAHLGKPVLAGDRGWYHDAGFVLHTPTRQAYLETLRRRWWDGWDGAAAARRAHLFAGWTFCRPAWQGSLHYGEDHLQEALYAGMPGLLAEHAEVLRREVATIRDWWESDERHLHLFKMRRAEAFMLPPAGAA